MLHLLLSKLEGVAFSSDLHVSAAVYSVASEEMRDSRQPSRSPRTTKSLYGRQAEYSLLLLGDIPNESSDGTELVTGAGASFHAYQTGDCLVEEAYCRSYQINQVNDLRLLILRGCCQENG